MRLNLICLLLAVAPFWAQAAVAPRELLASCIEDAERDSYGLQELEADCPGIEHALVELGFSPFIAENQLDQLSVYSLVDLQRLADRYAAGPDEAARGIATDSLAPILESLQEEQKAERPLTLLERAKQWLRDIFGRGQEESSPWINQWLEGVTMSEAVKRGIVYGLVIVVIVLAIAVLVNELRAAGVLRRRRRRAEGQVAMPGVPAADELTLSDLESAPPAQRPSVLLRLLVSMLAKRGRLRADSSLTHRELAAQARFDEDAQRECFGRITALGERTVYGDARVPPQELESMVQAGRALLSNIAAAPVPSPPVPQRTGK